MTCNITQNFYKFLKIYFICLFLYAHMCDIWRPEEGLRSSVARVMCSCELFDRGAENPAPIFRESSKHS